MIILALWWVFLYCIFSLKQPLLLWIHSTFFSRKHIWKLCLPKSIHSNEASVCHIPLHNSQATTHLPTPSPITSKQPSAVTGEQTMDESAADEHLTAMEKQIKYAEEIRYRLCYETGFLLAEFCNRTFWSHVYQRKIKFTSIYTDIVLKFGNVQDFQNFY